LLVFSVITILVTCQRGKQRAAEKGATAAQPPDVLRSNTVAADVEKYAHARVEKKKLGEGALAYWLYLPADPAPTSAPVVLFLHGWSGTDPFFYGGWIEHLARRGNIVIYPVYQTSLFDSPEDMLENAAKATNDAVEYLKKLGPVAQLDNFAIVGHSLGGGLGAVLTATAKDRGLPVPRALMAVQPGWRGRREMDAEKVKHIPASVLLLVVVGDKDEYAATRHSRTIFCNSEQLRAENKAFVVVQSDSHGTPPLVADHSSPLSPLKEYGEEISERKERRRKFIANATGMEGETNALDRLGYWRLFDKLLSAAFKNEGMRAVIGSTEDLSMGKWSDNTQVKPLLNEPSPCSTQ
jgi:dienelactone hydrolase